MLEDIAERMELPAEALLGAAKLSVTAGKRAVVENHRGVLEYSPLHIVIGTSRGKLSISGSDLIIRAMNKTELLITGRIQTAEWD